MYSPLIHGFLCSRDFAPQNSSSFGSFIFTRLTSVTDGQTYRQHL